MSREIQAKAVGAVPGWNLVYSVGGWIEFPGPTEGNWMEREQAQKAAVVFVMDAFFGWAAPRAFRDFVVPGPAVPACSATARLPKLQHDTSHSWWHQPLLQVSWVAHAPHKRGIQLQLAPLQLSAPLSSLHLLLARRSAAKPHVMILMQRP